jgi:hypothetical protein
MGPGREAATVRQVVLVIVLVAASFLGGAFVNGPGLRWIQTQWLGSLGLGEGGEIASIDLKGSTGPEATPADGSRPARTSPETIREPLAPVPSLISEGEANPPDASAGRTPPPSPAGPAAASRRAAPRSPRSSPPPLSGPLAAPWATSGPKPGDPSVISRPASPRKPAPAPLDPSVRPAAAPARPTPSDARPAAVREPAAPARAESSLQLVEPSIPASNGGAAATALAESLASLMPSGPPPPSSDPAPGGSAARAAPTSSSETKRESEPAGDADWAALSRRMQALGVSRFTIEGRPGGRVVFSCLIPIAGRQAVAQRFEAEGEDGFQAARAALRRVTLWRATQP